MSQSSVVEDGELSRRLGFITAIPQTVHRGSGCFVGISTLAAGATALGNTVEMITPEVRLGSASRACRSYMDCAARSP